jgi:glycine/sarcosine N-methyltransferase
MGFYEELAQSYDVMTDTPGRLQGAQEFIHRLLDGRRITRALDAACGTGLFSLPLAAMGVDVVASDASPAMIEQALKRSGSRWNLNIKWVVSPMEQLRSAVTGTFDAILCMGNSLPHLLEHNQLMQTLEGFAALLAPGGIAVLALLNYDRVLRRHERIIGIHRAGGVEYVRFYDFVDDLLRFNVLEIVENAGRFEHRLHSTTLRPWRRQELVEALNNAGMKNVETFGGMRFVPLDDENHETIMLLARKD